MAGLIIYFALLAAGFGLFFWLRNEMKRASEGKRRAAEIADDAKWASASLRRDGVFSAPVASQKSFPNAQYVMEYGDIDGVVSMRGVDIKAAEFYYDQLYLRAFCHLRNAERTFRADRILSIASSSDGMAIEDPSAFFRSMVPASKKEDPDHHSVMARAKPGLDVLIWIAMADREISLEEEEVLLQFIEDRKSLGGKKFAETPWNRVWASASIDSARPTFATAAGVLAKVPKTGKEYALLRDYAGKLAALGGNSADKRRAQLFKGGA